jgi:hypothetical protein
MSGRVWTCTRDPVFDALSLPLHPCVILLIAFAALSFRAHQRYAVDELASLLWRALLKTALALCGFFLFWACLIRFAFQMDPALILNAVPYVWSVAGWVVFWLVRRRWQLSGAAEPQRRHPGFMVQPVLHAWKTRGPAPELQGEADHVLTCIRIGRQSLIDKATGPGCALPGEFCENGKCYKIFGEHCTLGSECYSNTCEDHSCCQPLGQACNGSECCPGAACSAGRCATRGTSSPTAGSDQ